MSVIRGFGTFPPGTVLLQRFIPRTDGPGNHPHPCDFFIPRGGPRQALVVLHGGGGSKRSQAIFCRTLKTRSVIVQPKDVNWRRLDTFRCMEVYPLGQKCLPSNAVDNPWNPNGVDSRVAKRPDGVTAWSQGYFWSGANDPQFLKDLKTYILSEFATVQHVHLHGHSAGGMMTKYMWRFEPNEFSTYSTVSGPTPYHWIGATLPTVIKPLWMQVGLEDTILGIKDGIAGPGSHWGDSTWRQQPEQLSPINVKGVTVAGTWVPQLQETIPDWQEWQMARVVQRSLASLPAPPAFADTAYGEWPAKAGVQRIWRTEAGDLVLRRLSLGQHKYLQQQGLMVTPEGQQPTTIVTEVMRWINALPPELLPPLS